MKPEPTAEHQWLQKLLGEWTFETVQFDEAGEVTGEVFSGKETVRALGGLWIHCEMEAQGPDGQPSRSLMTLGYDPKKARFVGTFVSDMMPELWVYDGSMDSGGTSVTLNTEGPDFVSEGETGQYRDSIELIGPDERVFRSETLGPNGTWREFTKSAYRRAR